MVCLNLNGNCKTAIREENFSKLLSNEKYSARHIEIYFYATIV